jgi:hypothetical protein
LDRGPRAIRIPGDGVARRPGPHPRFHITQYLTRRAADWKARGVPQLGATSEGVRNPIGSAQGIAEQVQLRELLRRVIPTRSGRTRHHRGADSRRLRARRL